MGTVGLAIVMAAESRNGGEAAACGVHKRCSIAVNGLIEPVTVTGQYVFFSYYRSSNGIGNVMAMTIIQ